jgi:hypothetical protein
MKDILVVCGSQLKERCGIVCDFTDSSTFDVAGLDLNEPVAFYEKTDNGFVFCNPNFLQHVVDSIDLSDKVLITHNTDASLIHYENNTAVFEYLGGMKWSVSNVKPKIWLAQNSLVESVPNFPLGVTDNDIMRYMHKRGPKHKLIYKNFGTQTNPPQRIACDRWVPIDNEYAKSENREHYYNNLASSYFTVSPNGYGVDCHRHWEALCFDCIPIVTRSRVVEDLSTKFPMVIIERWEDFRIEDYTVELYNSMISSFDRNFLDIDFFINYYTK